MTQMREVRPLSPPPLPSEALWELTLEQLSEAIVQCLLQGPSGHYRIGRLYNHIVNNRRAVNAGYPTTREYFRRHVRVLSHASLVMFGAVVRKFPQEMCEKYGMASLGALLDYQRLHYGRNYYFHGRDPGDTPIDIPRRGGLVLTKPFADCTMDDLRQAVQAQRAHLRSPEATAPEA